MRWETKDSIPPELGQTRLLKRFAWLPTRVGRNGKFKVWLENYAQYQVYEERVIPTKFLVKLRVRRWFDTDRDFY